LQHLFERLADAAAETVRRGVVGLGLEPHRQRASDDATLPDPLCDETRQHAEDAKFVERIGNDRRRKARKR
jgi:hypothetical protein